MTRSLICLLCTLILNFNAFSKDDFFVFLPESDKKQLVHLRVKVEGGNAAFVREGAVGLPFAPSGTAFDSKKERLIVSGRSGDGTAAATVEVGPKGEIELLGTKTLPHPSGYTSVDRTDRFFLTVNYRSGELATYRIGDDGLVGEKTFYDKVPNKEAHCILPTLDNRYVYIPCVKLNNALFQFSFDDESGELKPLTPFNANPPALFGPRHVAYHPSLPIAYFSNEQHLGVSVYEIADDGQLNDLQFATSRPRQIPYSKSEKSVNASDIAISPDGQWIFVANRDPEGLEDCVFAFSIGEDGRLTLRSRTNVGQIPWAIDVSPKSTHLVVSESGEQKLSVFEIKSDGSLELEDTIATAGRVRDFDLR
ncbi:lactonase family protein [Pelagicoccus mobilis]|uniref:Beta-propeller fold lactonase family protein n=1 Tax=Pelagicoccus mobilis TaxID=415221 RepID=A0A934RVR5_9BACT|nr:beta-propeller fold lactonase family protein [Pelagicoccus mobilis]MBK1877273.1 beta-propeller fold lactonase family protein [Pelagicoccus mobilis]